MMRTIYVNGVAVGQVQSTGDPDVDTRIIRKFLEMKGLHREVSMVQATYRQALSFCQTAFTPYERDLVKAPTNGLSVVPFVVNAAFSIELYLKTLRQLDNASAHGHSLLKLYDALSDRTRTQVVAAAQAHANSYQVQAPSVATFRDCPARC